MILTDSIKENSLIAKEYKELLKISYQSLSKDDRKLIHFSNWTKKNRDFVRNPIRYRL